MSTSFLSSIQRFGFDPQRLSFGLRTCLAAFLSIVIAHAFGLEHPQWAAMTVWASSQPLREHLLERSLWRFLGTISGVFVGIALILVSATHSAYLVFGLAIWVGLCGAISLLQRGLVAYGTVLAGYSAAMVALLSTGNTDNVWLLGLDRFLTIAVGVATAVAVGYYFTPKIQTHPIREQLQQLTVDALQLVLKHMQRPEKDDVQHSFALLKKMAQLDEQLDAHAIGSFKSRRRVKQARQLVLAQLNLMLFLQNRPALPNQRLLQEALKQTIATLSASTENIVPPLSLQHQDTELIELINLLIGAHQQYFHPQTNPSHHNMPHMALHRNWLGALHTFVRSSTVLSAVGMVWLMTGWDFMPFMMLGLSVMLSVFVGFENPAWFLRHVTIGQIMGAILALLCVWGVWSPLAHSDVQMIAWMLPFMLFSVVVYAFKRTMLASFDCIMVMLILLQPHHPIDLSFNQSLANAVSVVMGPVIAMLAFQWIFPAHPQKRLQHLLSMVRFEIRSLCQSQASYKQQLLQRNRLVHSVLKAQRINDKLPQPDAHLSRELLRYLHQAQLIVCIHQSINQTASSSNQRLMRSLLQAWQSSDSKPEQIQHFCQVLKRRLPDEHPLKTLLP